MDKAIATYQQAYRKLQAANVKLEELRQASVPLLSTRVDTEWDEDGNATNWHDESTTDKAILRQFKSFRKQIETIASLGVKATLARRDMVAKIEEAANGGD